MTSGNALGSVISAFERLFASGGNTMLIKDKFIRMRSGVMTVIPLVSPL